MLLYQMIPLQQRSIHTLHRGMDLCQIPKDIHPTAQKQISFLHSIIGIKPRF